MTETEDNVELEEQLVFRRVDQDFDVEFVRRYYETIMKVNFPIADELEPCEVWEENLNPEEAAKKPPTHYKQMLLVGLERGSEHEKGKEKIAGGIAYEFYPASKCGLITYFVIDKPWRKKGLVKLLTDKATASLPKDCRLVFAETNATGVEDGVLPSRIRHQIFCKLGFGALACNYTQPPLSAEQEPCFELLLTVAKQSNELKKDEDSKDGKESWSVPMEPVKAWMTEFTDTLTGYTKEKAFLKEAYFLDMMKQFEEGPIKETGRIKVLYKEQLPWPGPHTHSKSEEESSSEA